MPTTVDRVKAWLRLSDDSDDAVIEPCVDAVNAWVGTIAWVAARSTTDPDTGVVSWPVQADQGATMLAARMYRRRNTPSGIEAMTDVVVYLPRRDSDVDQLLRVGAYQRPSVG